MLHFLLLSMSVGHVVSRTLDDWQALIRRNAAENPNAIFDETDTTGFDHVNCASSDITDFGSVMDHEDVQRALASISHSAGHAKPSIDWRKKGVVASVKDQGKFGTCWSFAAVENLEGLNAMEGNPLQNISNQQLIDCCPACDGRAATTSYDYLMNNTNGQIDTLESYPYKGKATKCKAQQGVLSTTKLHSYGRIKDDGSGDPLVAALTKYGPVGHGVDADCFAGYKSGVITNCQKASIDHAVLMVGAGSTDAGVDYYIIKNSWGANWGEHGYVRVARGKPIQAGISSVVWTQ